MSDLTEVIQDAITDQSTPEVPVETTEVTTSAPEGTPEATSAPETPEVSTSEVPSPATRNAAPEALQDEFALKHGLTPQRPGERENRIPYSAVKRIVGNAEKKALEPITKELGEYRTKVTEYESQLKNVAQFEQVMVSDPTKFLNMLGQIPAYKQIFDGLVARQQEQPTTPAAPDPNADMPQPDQLLSDGTKVYSMDGLSALNKWNREQARKEVMVEVERRISPFEEERKVREYQQRFQTEVVPQVQRQIDEARKWPQFNENETDIVKVLQSNPQLSLDGAYRQVVMPKLSSDYNAMRAKVLAELKTAPAATAITTSQSRPAPTTPSGPRNLSDVVMDAIRQGQSGH